MTTPGPITPSARLAGRTALVTGSTSGIGAAIARLLAARGAHVVISGRDAARGDAAVTGIREAGGEADFVPADLAASTGAVLRGRRHRPAGRPARHPGQQRRDLFRDPDR